MIYRHTNSQWTIYGWRIWRGSFWDSWELRIGLMIPNAGTAPLFACYGWERFDRASWCLRIDVFAINLCREGFARFSPNT